MVNQEKDPLAALSKEARDAVSGALSTKFPQDALLGVELSRLVSVCASVVKRHGLLLEKGIVTALEASGRFEILHTPVIPLTGAADSIVASNSPETLARIALRYDSPCVRSTVPDIVVIDPARGWAGAYQVKRMARPVCKRLLRPDLNSLHQRIRSQGSTLAKMEIRASRSS